MKPSRNFRWRFSLVQTVLISLGGVLVLEAIFAFTTGYTLPSKVGHARVVRPDEPYKFLLTGLPLLYIGWTWDKLVTHFRRGRPNQPLQGTPAKAPSSSTEPGGRRS